MNTDEHLMRMTVNAFRYMANTRDKSALEAECDVREEKPFKRANRISESTDAAASSFCKQRTAPHSLAFARSKLCLALEGSNMVADQNLKRTLVGDLHVPYHRTQASFRSVISGPKITEQTSAYAIQQEALCGV
jgi:hypothetical protein